MPAPPALTPQPGPATDLEALKIGRTPREYHLSAGKLEAFYGMMSRGDVPILVQLNDDHIVIWGTDDEHAVFGKFIKIVDSEGRKSSRKAVTVEGAPFAMLDKQRLEEVAAVQARRDADGQQRAALSEYRSSLGALMRDREAAQASVERARADAEVARAQAEELRSRNTTIYQNQRQAAEVAANAMRERSETLQSASRETEQRLRQLEQQLRQMEERAKRLERQFEESTRKAPKAKRTSTRSSSPIAETTTPEDIDDDVEIYDMIDPATIATVVPGNR